MDPEELTSPALEAIEEALASNYGDFDDKRAAWHREWQRLIWQRSKAKRRAAQRAQMGIAPADDEDDAA